MVTSAPSPSPAAANQHLAKESLLDEVIESASRLASKLLKLLVNTRCLSSAEEESEESAYTKKVLSEVANLAQNVATALPGGNIKNGVNVPVGNPDSLEQVKLTNSFSFASFTDAPE